MAEHGRFPLRLALYGVVAAYLVGDLSIFHGPLRQRLDLADPNSAASIEAAKSSGVIARVSGSPITRSQLDRALAERLWLDGKSITDLSPDETKIARKAALEDLIDHDLLRLQVKALATQLQVSQAEIDERLQRLVGRFENKGIMEKAMKSQGISDEKDLKYRLTARIQQEKFINLRIASFIRVTDEEAKSWYDANTAAFAIPERAEARHLFVPTLDFPPEEAKKKLEDARVALDSKTKDFAQLAKEVSLDPATKDSGGSLGWMTRERLPADFAEPVFSLPLNKPTLVRTKLGWHLVEVTARKPSEPRPYEQAKPEIMAAIEAGKRQQAVADFRQSLRKTASVKVEILQES